jgi:hypothetical protein
VGFRAISALDLCTMRRVLYFLPPSMFSQNKHPEGLRQALPWSSHEEYEL